MRAPHSRRPPLTRLPRRRTESGRIPRAYRITWDEEAREHRVALTPLARRR